MVKPGSLVVRVTSFLLSVQGSDPSARGVAASGSSPLVSPPVPASEAESEPSTPLDLATKTKVLPLKSSSFWVVMTVLTLGWMSAAVICRSMPCTKASTLASVTASVQVMRSWNPLSPVVRPTSWLSNLQGNPPTTGFSSCCGLSSPAERHGWVASMLFKSHEPSPLQMNSIGLPAPGEFSGHCQATGRSLPVGFTVSGSVKLRSIFSSPTVQEASISLLTHFGVFSSSTNSLLLQMPASIW
mmetsp:Transcript_19460/g.44291  ORF Transcript_19460/g.44291 Transcript_19460/m.44291 type:complete len:242 (-) Transcript_19460:348-1073(-)